MISLLMFILIAVCMIDVWLLRRIDADRNWLAWVLRISLGIEATVLGLGALLVYLEGLNGIPGTVMGAAVLVHKTGYLIYKEGKAQHSMRQAAKDKLDRAIEKRDETADQLRGKLGKKELKKS